MVSTKNLQKRKKNCVPYIRLNHKIKRQHRKYEKLLKIYCLAIRHTSNTRFVCSISTNKTLEVEEKIDIFNPPICSNFLYEFMTY